MNILAVNVKDYYRDFWSRCNDNKIDDDDDDDDDDE